MQIEHNEDAKKTAGNLSFSFLVRIARYPFLAIYIVVIPRMLGASDYGKLALIISIIMLSSEVLTFGISAVLGRYIPEYISKQETQKLERLLSGYFILELVIILILVLTGIILYFFIQTFRQELFPILLIYFAIIIEIYSCLVFAVLYGLNYVGKSNAINLFRTVFRLIFLFTLYPVLGFTGALLALIITPLLSSIYALYSVRKVLKMKYQKPILKEFIPKLKFGVIIFAPTLLFLFQMQIGPVFLKSFSFGDTEIGFFDLANQGFLVLYGLAMTGFDALIPISSKFQITGQEEKNINWLLMLLRYVLPILLIIVSGFYLFGDKFIMLILGEEYSSIYPIAMILLISIPIWVIGQLGYVRSVSLSKPKPYFLSTLYSTAVFIIFGIFAVKHFGVAGLASTIILSGITYSVSILLSYKEMISQLSLIVLKVFLSLISFLPLFIWNLSNIELKIIEYLACVSLFLIILLKLKIINIHELKQLISTLRMKSPGKEISLYPQNPVD